MFSKNSKGSKLVAGTLMAVFLLGSSTSLMAAQRDGRGWGGQRNIRRFSKEEVKEIARRNGYQIGMREGRNDSQRSSWFDRNRRSNPKDSRAYRDGMIGYRYEYGYERDYRNAFRNGFEDGYRAGFDRRGGFGNGPWGNGRGDNWPRRQY